MIVSARGLLNSPPLNLCSQLRCGYHRHLTVLRMRSPLCCSDDSSVTKLYSFPFSREQHNSILNAVLRPELPNVVFKSVVLDDCNWVVNILLHGLHCCINAIKRNALASHRNSASSVQWMNFNLPVFKDFNPSAMFSLFFA